MNIDVYAPYSESLGVGQYATKKCSVYVCQRHFNMRFGYFNLRDGLVDTSGARRRICKANSECNEKIFFLGMVEDGQWYCLHCIKFDGSQIAA